MKKTFAVKNNKAMFEIIQSLQTEGNLLSGKDFDVIKIPAQYRKQSKFWILNKILTNPKVRAVLLKYKLWSKPW